MAAKHGPGLFGGDDGLVGLAEGEDGREDGGRESYRLS